ncbi:uncharacterized protein LOC134837835 [Culicoides brevitarsis]|uniref:uncharacterized protein LOC134837835 n=1 Tax=Culicoides brevitarsis TaxID=469753 RepID=UPI00307CC21A
MDIIRKLDVALMSKRFPDFDQNDIQNIQIWLKKCPHLPKLTDYEIFRFLHAAEFSVEAAKTRIDNFYTFRTKFPQYFGNRDPDTEEIEYISEVMTQMKLPKETPDGHSIIYMNIFDSQRFTQRLYLKLSNICGDLECFADDITEGFIYLIDMKGFTFSTFATLNLTEIHKFVVYLTETYPTKIKHAHFINAQFPIIMDKLLNMIRPALRSELANNLHVHSSVESLAKVIPYECLPSDYEGGQLKNSRELSEEYRKYLLQHRDFFVEEAKQRRVDEKLRPAKMKSNLDIFGLEGNFKKLDFD